MLLSAAWLGFTLAATAVVAGLWLWTGRMFVAAAPKVPAHVVPADAPLP